MCCSASEPKGAKKTIEGVISLEYRHHGSNGAIDVLEKRHSRSIVVLKLTPNPGGLFPTSGPTYRETSFKPHIIDHGAQSPPHLRILPQFANAVLCVAFESITRQGRGWG